MTTGLMKSAAVGSLAATAGNVARHAVKNIGSRTAAKGAIGGAVAGGLGNAMFGSDQDGSTFGGRLLRGAAGGAAAGGAGAAAYRGGKNVARLSRIGDQLRKSRDMDLGAGS